MALNRKQITIEILDRSGNLVDRYMDGSYASSSFTKRLNAGLSDFTFEIPIPFDEKPSTLQLGYEIKVTASDIDGQVQIYSGEIMKIEAGTLRSTKILCYGFTFQLANAVQRYLPDGETDLPVNYKEIKKEYPSQELKTTLEDVIDVARDANPNFKINYASGSIEASGVTKKVKFNLKSTFDVINQILSLYPSNFYWYVDANNILYVKQISTTPDHYFVLGSQISQLNFNIDATQITNTIYLSNGLSQDDPDVLLKKYTDSDSRDNFGERSEIKQDGRFRASGTGADEFANRRINTFKNTLQPIELIILDNNLYEFGVDIESVQVGDTFEIINISESIGLSTNLVISEVEYDYASIRIKAEDATAYVSRQLTEQQQQYSDLAFDNNLPSIYTT